MAELTKPGNRHEPRGSLAMVGCQRHLNEFLHAGFSRLAFCLRTMPLRFALRFPKIRYDHYEMAFFLLIRSVAQTA